jgi:CheY-like chemotaxis protein
MAFKSVHKQVVLLLVTAAATLAAALTARFALKDDTGKFISLWIFSLAVPGLIVQGMLIRSALTALERSSSSELTSKANDEASPELEQARSRIDELKVQNERLMDRVASVEAAAKKETEARARGGSGLPDNRPVIDGLRSAIVNAGDRAQAVISGGTRLELGITLSKEEVTDVRKMMSAIGRDLARPQMEEVAESTPADNAVRLLLVEDDRTGRKIFRAMLPKDIPFHVMESEDGHAALLAVEQPPYPDVIVCDIMMPNMDGFEFVTKLRDMPRLANTPVIMISSNAFRENVAKAGTLDVCHFLKKPLVRTDVETAIRDAVQRNERKKSAMIEAQERLCLDDKAYFELAAGFSRAVTEAITFVRSSISRDRWQHATIRINALRGSIHLIGDERISAALGRIEKELGLWDVSRVTLELELLEEENERFMRTLIYLFAKDTLTPAQIAAVATPFPVPAPAPLPVAAAA